MLVGGYPLDCGLIYDPIRGGLARSSYCSDALHCGDYLTVISLVVCDLIGEVGGVAVWDQASGLHSRLSRLEPLLLSLDSVAAVFVLGGWTWRHPREV